MNDDESCNERYNEVQSALDVFVPGILGSVIESACYHLGKYCKKAESEACYDVAALKKAFV